MLTRSSSEDLSCHCGLALEDEESTGGREVEVQLQTLIVVRVVASSLASNALMERMLMFSATS